MITPLFSNNYQFGSSGTIVIADLQHSRQSASSRYADSARRQKDCRLTGTPFQCPSNSLTSSGHAEKPNLSQSKDQGDRNSKKSSLSCGRSPAGLHWWPSTSSTLKGNGAPTLPISPAILLSRSKVACGLVDAIRKAAASLQTVRSIWRRPWPGGLSSALPLHSSPCTPSSASSASYGPKSEGRAGL